MEDNGQTAAMNAEINIVGAKYMEGYPIRLEFEN